MLEFEGIEAVAVGGDAAHAAEEMGLRGWQLAGCGQFGVPVGQGGKRIERPGMQPQAGLSHR
jgi:hypothetical protein